MHFQQPKQLCNFALQYHRIHIMRNLPHTGIYAHRYIVQFVTHLILLCNLSHDQSKPSKAREQCKLSYIKPRGGSNNGA